MSAEDSKKGMTTVDPRDGEHTEVLEAGDAHLVKLGQGQCDAAPDAAGREGEQGGRGEQVEFSSCSIGAGSCWNLSGFRPR